MTKDQIYARCQAAVAAGARYAFDDACDDLFELTAGPAGHARGPVVAAAFSDSIQHGCQTLGALTDDGLPDVARFEPAERGLFFRLPASLPPQAIDQVRRIYQLTVHDVRTFVTARAAGDLTEADQIYQRVTAAGHLANFVFQLWATASIIHRHVQTQTAGRPGPACDRGTPHLRTGQSAGCTCGPLHEPNTNSNTASFASARRQILHRLAALLRDRLGR
ncbi:hypothetical protein GCM10010411_74710 [Actinomadura fulvescens]|uniref:Uncharacterized protein n=1 Tax=Actinomadura fulvescens TaxID=46160 RepID=A0ABN3QHX6_9ACTN